MKKIYSLLFIFLTFSCVSIPSYELIPVKKYNGNPKKVESTLYQIETKNGKEKEVMKMKTILYFNDNGQVIKLLGYGSDGNLGSLNSKKVYDKNGNKIGDDGVDNGVNVMVNNDELAQKVKEVNSEDGNVDLLDEQFSFTSSDISLLPSDAALKESINVLDRTEGKTSKDSKGGLHGESSIVLKSGSVLRGESGDATRINSNNEIQTDETLPSLPLNMKDSDVETTIHSHVTGSIVKNGQVYGQNAKSPSDNDSADFSSNRGTNIIVGRLGPTSASRSNGNNTVSQPTTGVVVYRNGSSTPSVTLKRKTVEKIIKN